MKKIFVILFLLPIFLAFAGQSDKKADQIVDKYVSAIGGADRLNGVTSVVMYGTMFAQGLPLDMKMSVVPPDKAYLELSVSGMAFGGGGTDGTNAWQKTPIGTFYLTDNLKDAATKQGDVFPLLDYKKRGIEVTFVGDALVKGKDALKVRAVSGSDTTYHYFDANSYYLLKSESNAGSLEMSQYKPVGDIVMSHKLSGHSAEGDMTIDYDSIFVNVPVPDSLFVMPADAKPLPKSMEPGSQGE